VLVNDEIVGIIRAIQADPDRMAQIQAARAALTNEDAPAVAARALGGTVYATRIGAVLEALAQRHPASIELDHTWFFPPLKPGQFPKDPFKGLRPYLEADRAIYFGRDVAIRDLLKMLGTRRPQLLLLHGPAGAGKSSLLAAGLSPYLKARYDVRVEPRREAGFAASIATARLDGLGATKPLILVIDQAENAFLTAGKADYEKGRAELRALLDARREADLAFKTGAPDTPRMNLQTVVVSYRKEWHAEISRVSETTQGVEQYELAPMTRAELVTALTEIGKTLRGAPDSADVDDALFTAIAPRVASEREALAPILQILMTRLWTSATEEADKRSIEEGRKVPPRLHAGMFDAEHEKLGLADFLGRQLAPSDGRPSTSDYESGLALSILRFHTSRTASVRKTRVELLSQYGERDGAVVRLVDELGSQGLLALATDKSARLVHDALSPVVCREYEKSLLIGQRAERRLQGRMQERSLNEDVVFVSEERRTIRPGLAGMRTLEPAEQLALYRSSLTHPDDDVAFWYEQAARTFDPLVLRRELTPERLANVSVIRSIVSNPALLREMRAIIFAKLLAVTDEAAREQLGVLVAQHMLPFEPDELRILGDLARDLREGAVDLLAWTALSSGELPKLPKRLGPKVRERAGQLLHERARSERVQLAATRYSAGTTLIVLALAFLVFVPSWLAVTGAAKMNFPTVGNLMPPFAWSLAVGLLMGPWAFRRQVVGMATRPFFAGWRAFPLRFYALAVPLQALLLGFSKGGAEMVGQGHAREYTDPGHILEDFILCMGLAALLSALTWLATPILARVVRETPRGSGTQGWRYLRTVLLGLGVPVIVSVGIVTALSSMSDLCRIRIDTPVLIAMWIACVTGMSTMFSAIALGMSRAADLIHPRRALLLRRSDEGPVSPPRWSWFVIFGAFVVGLVLTLNFQNRIGFHEIGSVIHRCPLQP